MFLSNDTHEGKGLALDGKGAMSNAKRRITTLLSRGEAWLSGTTIAWMAVKEDMNLDRIRNPVTKVVLARTAVFDEVAENCSSHNLMRLKQTPDLQPENLTCRSAGARKT